MVQELAGLKTQGLAPAAPAEAPPTGLSCSTQCEDVEKQVCGTLLLPEPAGGREGNSQRVHLVWN